MDVSRSSYYYSSKGESQANLDMMKEIDRIVLEHPATGVQKLSDIFRLRGHRVNHKRISRLMKVMGIECVYPRICLSRGGKAKYVHPYLLRNFKPDRPNAVWSTDISYIPVEHGFMYLYAVIDVYSRFIVGWRLSNDLSGGNCTAALLEDCICRHGIPDIFNTDQGRTVHQ